MTDIETGEAMWRSQEPQGSQGRRQALQTLGALGLGTAVVTGLAGCGSLNPLSRAPEVAPTAVPTAIFEVVADMRSEEHTSELQSQSNLVCRLLLEKKKKKTYDK